MRFLLTVCLLFLALPAAAQTTVQYEVDWFFQGANAPFQSDNVMGDDSQCVDGAILPQAPNNVVNPSSLFLEHDWDEDGDLDVCEFFFRDLVTPLVAGDYYGRAKARSIPDPTLVSGGSADSNPFAVAGVPADPAALVIR